MPNPSEKTLPPSAMPLREVRRLLRGRSAEEFVREHGRGFLVYTPPAASANERPLGRTVVLDGPIAEPPDKATDTIVVFPVRPSGRSPFPDFVSVGRAGNNDIVIPEPSLSKFHAFFRISATGEFSLLDAGSQNGTFLDDRAVPTKERGQAVPVTAGSSLRFGGAVCTFVSVDGLQLLARFGEARG